jgi:large subunit ribosomal protein L32e
MATKEEFIEEASKLPGVSKKAAEALYEAGITSMDDLKGKSKEELTAIKGIGPKTADAILAGEGAEQKADEIQVVESKKTKGKDAKAKKKAGKEEEAKPEVVEPEAVYRVKIKAEIGPELKRALEVRAIRLDQQPAFRKYHWWYAVRVKEAWRAPKGELSKQRRGFKYRPPRVKVGYGKPALSRHLHPSGFEEIMVANPDQLSLVLDPKTQAVRIQGSVGKKKAKAIEAAAAEKNIRILNPRRT